MKFLVFLALASVASSAKLDKVYLPPNARLSSGASAGLQTPLAPQRQVNFGASQNLAVKGQANFGASQNLAVKNQAEILRYDNEINEEGFHYAYETSDGTKAEQEGKVIPGAKPEEGSIQVSGSYSYVGDDGQTYSITYTADENGYHAEGAHLPTPPPIPEEILKSLQLTARSEGQYNSRKSSYDADAGY